MTMMATKVKLAVGQPPVILNVTEIVEVEGNYGPQARITGDDHMGAPVTIYEKLDSVTRQLGRCGVSTIGAAVGMRLKFWKETATNGAGQSFPALRIDSEGGAPAPVVAAPPRQNGASTTKQPTSIGAPLPWENQETGAAPAPAPAPNGDRIAAQFAVYSRCLDKARAEVLRTGMDQLGGDVAGAIAAIAATLYIQANK